MKLLFFIVCFFVLYNFYVYWRDRGKGPIEMGLLQDILLPIANHKNLNSFGCLPAGHLKATEDLLEYYQNIVNEKKCIENKIPREVIDGLLVIAKKKGKNEIRAVTAIDWYIYGDKAHIPDTLSVILSYIHMERAFLLMDPVMKDVKAVVIAMRKTGKVSRQTTETILRECNELCKLRAAEYICTRIRRGDTKQLFREVREIEYIGYRCQLPGEVEWIRAERYNDVANIARNSQEELNDLLKMMDSLKASAAKRYPPALNVIEIIREELYKRGYSGRG